MAERTAIYDLETIANPAIVDLLPEVKARGNLKDPVKIEADLAEKKLKQKEEMGLEPSQALIACACIYDLEKEKTFSFPLDPKTLDEKPLLHNFWDTMFLFDRFVSFNGNTFDIPMLLWHSMINRIMPTVDLSRDRYKRGNHTDVRMLLTNNDIYGKGTLDYFCQIITGESKPEGMSGSMIQDMWDIGLIDDIIEYCKQDVRILGNLYNQLKGYYC